MVPLPGLLSQALVAFTIELDNEFEHRMPHRTTRGPAARSGAGPWLVSLPMWSNYLRWLPGDAADLAPLVNLGGLRRWSYLDAAGNLTRAGERARRVWDPLPAEIETRWTDRYGDLAELRSALGSHPDLPWCLPVAALSRVDRPVWTRGPGDELVTLLSQALLACTLEFESRSPLSLAISANVLRVLGPDGTRIRDLPALAGVAKEQVEQSVAFLVRHGCAETADRVVRLTEAGRRARARYRRLAAEQRDDRLRAAPEHVLADPEKLRRGLTPYEDGWRARPPYARLTAALLADPTGVLPHQPMVSHRGGFPDGS